MKLYQLFNTMRYDLLVLIHDQTLPFNPDISRSNVVIMTANYEMLWLVFKLTNKLLKIKTDNGENNYLTLSDSDQ